MSPLRVLVLDADGDARRILHDFLLENSCVVLDAAELPEAYLLANAVAPDVIVTACWVPRPGGDCAPRALRKHPLLASTPMVVWTAVTKPASVPRCIAESGATLVPKPSSPRAVLEAIESAATAQRRNPRLPLTPPSLVRARERPRRHPVGT